MTLSPFPNLAKKPNIVIFLFLLLFPSIVVFGQGNSETKVILGATLIDGLGGEPIEDTAILIHKGRIKKVGPMDEVQYSPNADIIRADGLFAMPGLVDTHAHIWETGRLYASSAFYDLRHIRDPEEEREWLFNRLDYTLTRFIASGVTSFVDLSGPLEMFDVRDDAKNNPLAPRMGVAGRFIGDFNFSAFDFLWTVEDPAVVSAANPIEARALVQENLEYGPEVIKCGYIGVMPLEDFEPILAAIIDESHQNGKKVAYHSFDLASAKLGMRLGVDILAHTIVDQIVDQEFLDLALANNVTCVSSLMLFEGMQEVITNENPQLTRIEEDCGDQEVIDSWYDLQSIPLEDRPNLNPFALDATNKIEIMQTNLKKIHDAGIKISIGSDSGNIGLLHGAAVHREMELVQEAGIPPMSIITAATRNGASFFSDDPNFGTIQKGKRADILLLSADPTTNISNTQALTFIIRDGRVYTKEELRDLTPEDFGLSTQELIAEETEHAGHFHPGHMPHK